MRKLVYILTLTVFVLGFCGKTGNFTPMEKLKPLKLSLVANFTELEELGLIGDVELLGKREAIFYDAQKKAVYRTPLSTKELTPIGRPGEGPGEYSSLSDLYVNGNRIYMVDRKDKIIMYSTEGKFLSEQKLKSHFFRAWFLGKIDKDFIMATLVMKNRIEPYLGIYRWRNGKEPELITENPVSQKTTKRESDGKIAFQIFFISLPSYAVVGNKIFAAASHRYTFSFLNKEGKILKNVTIEAPKPQLFPFFRKIKGMERNKAYAIIYAHQCREKLCVISSYFKENFPRLDVFSTNGRYLKSYILPLEYKRPIAYSIKIQGDYLIYYSIDESGFKIYRLPEKI